MKPQDRTRAILRSALTPTERLVLVALADFCGDQQVCWPSMAALVESTGLTDRAIQKVLAKAEAQAWITRRTKTGFSTTYELHLAALPPLPPRNVVRPRTTFTPEPGSPLPPNVVHPSPERGSGVPPNVVHPEATIRSDQRSDQENTTPEPPAEPPAAPVVDQPQQAAVTQPKPAKGQDTANVMAAYRVWREVTPARKAAPSVGETRVMLQRIRQDGATVEDLAVVFRWAATSDETYPRQIRGEAPWHDGECKRHLSIETLCKAERWTKRLEEARAWSEGRAIVQQAAERPWETPGTGSPYRTGSPELVREWVTLNAAEVDRVRAAIRQAGKGWAELAQWLASRVTDPEAVLREIRRPVANPEPLRVVAGGAR